MRLRRSFQEKYPVRIGVELRRTPDTLSSKRQRQEDFEVNLSSFRERIEKFGIAFCNIRFNTTSFKGQAIVAGRVN